MPQLFRGNPRMDRMGHCDVVTRRSCIRALYDCESRAARMGSSCLVSREIPRLSARAPRARAFHHLSLSPLASSLEWNVTSRIDRLVVTDVIGMSITELTEIVG